jgi:predicted dienelactone hydrolase
MQSIRSVLIILLANTTAGFLLPNPSGKYNVTLTTGPLVDYNRSEPDPRALMLSIFQPTRCAATIPVPYMPNKTAEYQGPYLQQAYNISVNFAPLFMEARLPVCPNNPAECTPLEDSPILLFSPGFGGPRLYYSAVASALASEGFMVITIDHPGDANIITYPNGHAIYNNGSGSLEDVDFLPHYAYPRAADASFVVDQLSNATAMGELLPQRGARKFQTDRVAMLGHSLGGSTAVLAASQDSRIRGAINFDGTIFGSLPAAKMSQPVLLVSSAGRADASWDAWWSQLDGPKLWLSVANTKHTSFIDFSVLIQAAGLDLAPFADLLGTVSPSHLIQLMVSYTTAWMNGAFAGKVGGALLEGKEPERFPEVSTVMQGNF